MAGSGGVGVYRRPTHLYIARALKKPWKRFIPGPVPPFPVAASDTLTVSVADTGTAIVLYEVERLPPDAILNQANLTGAVADIDEDPDSPDANWLIGSSTTPPNIVPTPTSGLETLPAGWALRAACTLTQDSTQAHSGSFCLGQTKVAGVANMACQPANHPVGGSISIPVIEGNVYTAKVWSRASTVARTAFLFLYWWDDDQVELTGTGESLTNSTSAWSEIVETGRAPATATQAQLILQINGAADGEKHLWDDLQLYEADLLILRVSFPSPSGQLKTGAGLQEFRVRARPG